MLINKYCLKCYINAINFLKLKAMKKSLYAGYKNFENLTIECELKCPRCGCYEASQSIGEKAGKDNNSMRRTFASTLAIKKINSGFG